MSYPLLEMKSSSLHNIGSPCLLQCTHKHHKIQLGQGTPICLSETGLPSKTKKRKKRKTDIPEMKQTPICLVTMPLRHNSFCLFQFSFVEKVSLIIKTVLPCFQKKPILFHSGWTSGVFREYFLHAPIFLVPTIPISLC